MEIFNNSDGFFREIRSVEVFLAQDIAFSAAYQGLSPTAAPVARFLNIIPETFKRSLRLKYNNDNEYYEVDLSFALQLGSHRISDAYRPAFGKRKFAVRLTSNTDSLVLGNHREPLTVDLQDGLKDDNSGTDQYEVSIYGSTIIDPRFVLS